MVCLAGEGKLASSRKLEEKLRFSQQRVFGAGRKHKKCICQYSSGSFVERVLNKNPGKITVQKIPTAFDDAFRIDNAATCPKAASPALKNYNKELLQIETETDKLFSLPLSDLV